MAALPPQATHLFADNSCSCAEHTVCNDNAHALSACENEEKGLRKYTEHVVNKKRLYKNYIYIYILYMYYIYIHM